MLLRVRVVPFSGPWLVHIRRLQVDNDLGAIVREAGKRPIRSQGAGVAASHLNRIGHSHQELLSGIALSYLN